MARNTSTTNEDRAAAAEARAEAEARRTGAETQVEDHADAGAHAEDGSPQGERVSGRREGDGRDGEDGRPQVQKVETAHGERHAAILKRYRELKAQKEAAGEVSRVVKTGRKAAPDAEAEGEDEGEKASAGDRDPDAGWGEEPDDDADDGGDGAPAAQRGQQDARRESPKAGAKAGAKAGEAERGKTGSQRATDAGGSDTARSGDGEKYVLLKINGEYKEVTLERAKELAQKAAASENILEEAKRVLKTAESKARATEHQRGAPKDADAEHQRDGDGRASRKAASRDAAEPADADGAPEHQRDEAEAGELTDDDFREAAEKVQVGDTEEGAQALRKLFERAKGTPTRASIAPEEIGRQVQAALTQSSVAAEIKKATAQFQADFPEVATDPLLADAAITALRLEIIKDLKEAGIPGEHIEPAKRDVNLLARAHFAAMRAGARVRQPGDLILASGKVLTDRFGIKPQGNAASGSQQQRTNERGHQPGSATGRNPQGSPAGQSVEARLDRKRALSPQPRSAGVRAQMTQAPRPATPRESLERMRQQRGYQRTM